MNLNFVPRNMWAFAKLKKILNGLKLTHRILEFGTLVITYFKLFQLNTIL